MRCVVYRSGRQSICCSLKVRRSAAVVPGYSFAKLFVSLGSSSMLNSHSPCVGSGGTSGSGGINPAGGNLGVPANATEPFTELSIMSFHFPTLIAPCASPSDCGGILKITLSLGGIVPCVREFHWSTPSISKDGEGKFAAVRRDGIQSTTWNRLLLIEPVKEGEILDPGPLRKAGTRIPPSQLEVLLPRSG